MDISGALLLALLHVAAMFFISKIIIKRQQCQRKLPPGPKPWPIIGNLNLIGSVPHQSLHFLFQKYGEIMLLKFGKFPVVVASSPEMAKQFLKTHDAVFASRPPLAAGKYTAYNYSNMLWSPYGAHWRQARKIFMTEVFSAKTLESFTHIRVEERRNFLSRLRSLSGKPVVLRDHLSRYTLSNISRLVGCSKYFIESEHGNSIVKLDELLRMLDELFLLSGAVNIGDWIPWLDFLDLNGYVKRMKSLSRKFDRFYNHVIDDHQATRKDSMQRDVVDVFLQLAEDPKSDVKLTRDSMKGYIQDFLAAGTDTSATSIEWTIHEMLRHPHVMEKAKEELDRVIGKSRWVEEDDCSKLPYIDAVIMESLRLHPLSTLLAPHYAIDDCKVAGYDISKGTTILINVWSIGRNPTSYDAPEHFLPERFLGKEIDLSGSNFALLPFGSGRRRCPGYNLGLKIVRTIVANLVHGFELKLVPGMSPEDISTEEAYGLVTHPKEPVPLLMEPILPSHLY